MKLLPDVRKADWRLKITVLHSLPGGHPNVPPRWRAVPLLARPSPHLLARPPYRRDSAICAGSLPLCRRSGRVTVTGRGHGDRLKLACATARTTTFAGFGACQSGLAAEMNSGGRAEKLGIDESSAAMWPPTVHSGTVRACAAKSGSLGSCRVSGVCWCHLPPLALPCRPPLSWNGARSRPLVGSDRPGMQWA